MTKDMEPSLIKCSKCQAILLPVQFNTGQLAPCAACGSPVEVEVFPAILQAPVAATPVALLVEGESSCFYHPAKRASIVCQECGRFLCALCDLELNGRHVCPTCLNSGQRKGKFKDLENSRKLWDHLALTVAVAPVFICLWPSIIGAPMALYLVLRYRKEPCSLTGRSNLSFIAAAVLALAQMAGWTLVLLFYLTKR
jgi:DNA-directed RNA polymerase subunit M/transcription elongation factor TFIIS